LKGHPISACVFPKSSVVSGLYPIVTRTGKTYSDLHWWQVGRSGLHL